MKGTDYRVRSTQSAYLEKHVLGSIRQSPCMELEEGLEVLNWEQVEHGIQMVWD